MVSYKIKEYHTIINIYKKSCNKCDFMICTPFTGYPLKGGHIKLGVQNLFNRIFYNDEAIAGRTYSVSMKFKF